MAEKMNKKLVLEDGSEYMGYGFGGDGLAVCEIVFNTAMAGYQEVVSDSAYAGQIVVMTYPLIGNYGIAEEDFESKTPSIGGLAVRECNDSPSNFRYTKTLSEVLEENRIPAIWGLDTRALTRHIRDSGPLKAVIADAEIPTEDIAEHLKSTTLPRDLVSRVSCGKKWYSRTTNPKYNLVAVDLGARLSAIKAFNRLGCNVTVVPFDTTAEEICAMKPDGVLFSSGPGDPKDGKPAIELARALRGSFPLFGIALGHQVLALAYGADTFRLKSPHHGSNIPVRDLATGKIEITSQAHNYAVDAGSVGTSDMDITHLNVLDGTVAGLACKKDNMYGVQYYPDAMPDKDSETYLITQFVEIMRRARDNA